MSEYVRSSHPYAFRSGEWAEIIVECEARGRPCWLVKFEDGVTDILVQDDPVDEREFSHDPGGTGR